MRNRKFVALFFLLSIFGHGSTRANSVKSPEVILVGHMGSVISMFESKFHRSPSSWSEIINTDLMPPEFWTRFRTKLDFERRYRFLDPSVSVSVTGQVEKIVVMASEPGREGNRDEQTHEPGRWLVVEMPSGDIQTRNYSEALLEKLFERAGSDLKDYTTSEGKWFEVEATPEMDAAISARASSKKLAAERRHKQREIAYSNSRSERRKPMLWGVAAVSILVFAMLVAIWKRLRKRSQRKVG